MKTFLLLCLALAGLAGFAPAGARAAEPAVVHVNETVIVEHGPYYHHHHRYYHHRRYYYRHHRRYYY